MASDSWGDVLKFLTTEKSDSESAAATLGQQLAAMTAQLASAASPPTAVAAASQTGSTALAEGSNGVGSTILGFLGAGMGVSPLLNGLFSLFGGGDTAATPAVLPTYLAPASVQFEGLYDSGSGSVAQASTGQGGQERALPKSTAAAPASQITVNVQAMDSQSFLDHSDDIARAVRQAMLQSNVLNDVVREL